ncbi:MAG: T9SS type A sorting domain-containing protein [Bacteroidetes bacterium]|nr:T9SS type A sorting domain-containing protein [Bacteroidota bacterium]
MKRILYPVILALLIMFSTAGTTKVNAYPSGAPSGRAGGPAESGATCYGGGCHSGAPQTVSGFIMTNIPPSGYVAGTTYTITVSFTGSGGKGFELSPQDASGNQIGTLVAGTGSHTVGGTKYCTQSSKQSSSTASWNFQWVAPATAGSGSLSFYGAFAISTSTTKKEFITVNEDAAQPLAVVASANPTTLLSGTTSQLNAAATGGSGSYTYSWTSSPAGFTSSIQNPVVSPTLTTIYTVQVSDGTSSVSGNATVTVIPNNLQVTVSANPTTINQGQTSQLNAAASGGSGSNTYSWTSNPAGFTSSLQSPVVNPAVTTQYTCSVNDGFQSTSGSATVTVNAIPLGVTVTATPSGICSGSSSQLNAVANGGSGSYTYSWTSVPPGFISAQHNPQVTPVVNTKYFVLVNDGVHSINDSVAVTVQAAPTVSAGSDTIACLVDTQVPLNGSAFNASSLLWSTSGDGTFSNTSTSQSIYYPGTNDKANFNVDLTLTANGILPCNVPVHSVKHIQFVVCDGVPSIKGNELSFSFWPNPTTGRLTLNLKRTSASPLSLQISDLTGNMRYQEKMDLQDLSITRTLNLETLPAGVYMVKIECGNAARVQKLVIL